MSLYCLALEQPKAKLPRLDISLEKSRDLAEVTLWRNSASRASTGQEGQHRQVHRYDAAAALLWRKLAKEPAPGGTIGKAGGLHQRRQVHRYAVTLQKGRKFDWIGGRSISSRKDAKEGREAMDPSKGCKTARSPAMDPSKGCKTAKSPAMDPSKGCKTAKSPAMDPSKGCKTARSPLRQRRGICKTRLWPAPRAAAR
jgi:hypothetical protein